jgi:hypothetical protein
MHKHSISQLYGAGIWTTAREMTVGLVHGTNSNVIMFVINFHDELNGKCSITLCYPFCQSIKRILS